MLREASTNVEIGVLESESCLDLLSKSDSTGEPASISSASMSREVLPTSCPYRGFSPLAGVDTTTSNPARVGEPPAKIPQRCTVVAAQQRAIGCRSNSAHFWFVFPHTVPLVQ